MRHGHAQAWDYGWSLSLALANALAETLTNPLADKHHGG